MGQYSSHFFPFSWTLSHDISFMLMIVVDTRGEVNPKETKAHDNRSKYRKSAEKGAMRPMAQIRTTVKLDGTKTNKG